LSRRISIQPIIGLALLAAATAGSAWAKSPYDGSWSVLVITESGGCDQAYRYAVRIEDGQLRPGGEASVQLAGRVNGGGLVQVKIGRGDQSASATGRLSQTGGSGSWKGKSKQQQCHGRWEAERR
jgi:hypothetical protein